MIARTRICGSFEPTAVRYSQSSGVWQPESVFLGVHRRLRVPTVLGPRFLVGRAHRPTDRGRHSRPYDLLVKGSVIKIEYDPGRDLLYIWFAATGTKAAQTVTVTPGVHADFDAGGKLVGVEVLDAAEVLGRRVEFEVAPPTAAVGAKA